MKYKFKIIKTLPLLIAIFCFFLLPSGSLAQTTSLGIYPPILQIDSTPPTDIKSPISIENSSDEPVSVNISLKAFRAADSENGQIEMLDNFSSFADPLLVNRVKFLEGDKVIKSLNLAPKQIKNIDMEIKLPSNEAHGDYYFTIIFTSVPQSSILTNSSLQTVSVGTNVLLTVGPKGPVDGFIKNFSTDWFYNKGPVIFNVDIFNKSDHFVTPTGQIIIKDVFGKEVGKVELLSENILSQSSRKIRDANQSDPNSKEYKSEQNIVESFNSPVIVWPQSFLIGPYQADLSISMSDSGPTFKRSIHFFAFPLIYLTAIIIIIAITIFIILRVKKRINNI